MINESFDRAKLSYRENEILDLAIDGLTDQQIAMKLEISPSTVNSYWVRIRGKLGHLSRTELVSTILRQEAQAEVDRLTRHSKDLESRLILGERLLEESNYDEQYKAILDTLPEPLMALSQTGKIVYANERLADLFDYCLVDLFGKPVELLIPSGVWINRGIDINEHLSHPGYKRLGVDSVLYGCRQTGAIFRIIVTIDSSTTSGKTMHVCLVRGFIEELDEMRRRAAATVTHINARSSQNHELL